MTKNSTRSGIGGLLLLLILWLTFFAPMYGFGKLTLEFSESIKQFPHLATNAQFLNYKQYSFIIFAASALISFAAGIQLWRVHFPESVRFAILAIWLSVPFAKILNLAAALWIYREIAGPSKIEEMILTMLGSTFSSCVVAGIWTAYLLRSARVKNTYNLPYNQKRSTIKSLTQR